MQYRPVLKLALVFSRLTMVELPSKPAVKFEQSLGLAALYTAQAIPSLEAFDATGRASTQDLCISQLSILDPTA